MIKTSGINPKILDEINKTIGEKIFIDSPSGFVFIIDEERQDIKIEDNQIFSSKSYLAKVLFELWFLDENNYRIDTQKWELPKFSWRGVMLDIARTFYSKNDIKKIMLISAFIGMNKFHLHTSDDQGFRFKWKGFNKAEKDAITLEEMKELQDFAILLSLDLIIEIDTPGHVQALLALDNGLACNDKLIKPWSSFGVSQDILCVNREENVNKIKNIFDKIIDKINPQYFHLGGDECPLNSWDECQFCSKLNDGTKEWKNKLFARYINQQITYLEAKHIKPIVYDDAFDYAKISNVTVMVWRTWLLNQNNDYINEIASQNNYIIHNDVGSTYFDFRYSKEECERVGMDQGWVTDIHKVMAFNPLKNIDPKFHHLVLGSQASLWTERIKTFDELVTQLLPRGWILANTLWNGETNENELHDLLEKTYFLANKFNKEISKIWWNG